jgi:signal transduction histidine kinase
MLGRLRPRALGLRARIVGALLLTSAAVLGIAAVALLSPLERRLRTAEQRSLAQLAPASRSAFADLPPQQIALGSGALRRVARALAQRSGATLVALLDPSHVLLVRLDPDALRHDDLDDSQRAFATGAVISSIGSIGGEEVARVAIPLDVGGRRYVIIERKPTKEVGGAVATVRRAFLAGAGGGLLLALVLGIGIAYTLVRRLRRLRDAALRVAEQGLTADEVAADPGRDEVADLTRAFATMQQRLRQQEEARRAFVATASHELRTPLASLHGMLELLDEDLGVEPADLEDARTQVDRARAQTSRLSRLAGDLLDLSRIDAEVELRSEPVELAEVARAVMAEFDRAAAGHSLRLALDGEDSHARALADPGSVARILRILIDNAIRFSPAGGTLQVAVTEDGAGVEVDVRDGGPGVPEEERELIFERFQRGRGAAARAGREAGFGLGLAIGRELARRMGGDLVLADGGADGAGACFSLRLPPAPPID